MRRGGLSSQNNEDNNEKEDKSGVKTKRGNKPWLFLLCAWACYMRYVSTTTVSNEKTTTSPVDMNSFINVIETPENPQSESIPSVVENVGLTIALSEEEEEIEKESKKKEEKTKSLQVGDNSEEHQVGERDDDIDNGKGGTNLPMIGATMALSGKCTSPDYGTKLFYIKTKHTGSGKLAGILRRIGSLHNMVIADPVKGANSFKDESDFHKVAQGKCVDMLVAHTPRASWQDKAFKGSLKIASIRDPILRAISAYEHSIKCGQHCSMCWKLINDKVRWARQCHDVADAQYNLMRGVYEDVEDIIDDYDFVLVTERYLESLIVLRHVLGISLVEMLYIDIDDEGDTEGSDSHVVSLTGQPQRFLDVVVSRNQNDRKLYDTANMVLDDKIRIIGRSVVRKEARELKIMLDMLRHTCRDRAKSKELMGSTYMYSRDCLWHQQGCGNLCITRWSSLYETARATKS